MQSGSRFSTSIECWIFLSIAWWLGSLAAWLVGWLSWDGTGWTPWAELAACSLMTAAVALALRLPILYRNYASSDFEDHFVWLLAVGANVNWLGLICLQSEHLPSMVPLVSLNALLECWLMNTVFKRSGLAWLRRWCRSASRKVGCLIEDPKMITSTELDPLQSTNSAIPPQISNSTNLRETQNHQPVTGSIPKGIANNSAMSCDHAGDQVESNSHTGVDASGRRFQAGDLMLKWLPGQSHMQLVIGFSPAFGLTPSIEFDVEDDSIQLTTINQTPLGVRINARRQPPLQNSRSILSWYAVENSDGSEATNAQPQVLA
jgi:hypothetical protein